MLKEILLKTKKLIKTRLGYLSLYREIPTLSGGELQRLFLNAHLDSKMDSLIKERHFLMNDVDVKGPEIETRITGS
jgi:translation initiation factor RLI1